MADQIAVIGATGRTGLEVVKHLLQRKIPIIAIVRDEERAKKCLSELPTETSAIAIRQVSLKDTEGLKSALAGIKAVIFAAGGLSFLGIANRACAPVHVDYEGVCRVSDAIKSMPPSQQPKFILVSSIGVTRPWWPMGILINAMAGMVMKWKRLGEEHLRASGIDYCIVRPGALKEGGKAKEPIPTDNQNLVIDQGDTMGGRIRRSDVALVCIEAAYSAQASRTTFEVCAANKKLTDTCSEPSRNFSTLFALLKRD